MFQTVLLAHFWINGRAFGLVDRARRDLVVPVVITVVVLLLAFPAIREYRDLARSGGGLVGSLGSALTSDSDREPVWFEIMARVGGIGTYGAARYLGSERSRSADLILSNAASQTLKEELYGDRADSVATGFSTTQFAALYFFGGKISLLLGALLLGLVVRFTSDLIARFAFQMPATFYGFLPVLCLLWCKLLLTGGNFILRAKEVIVVLIVVIALERLVLALGRRRIPYRSAVGTMRGR